MPTTRAGKKTGVAKASKDAQNNNDSPFTIYTQTQITPKKNLSQTTLQSSSSPMAISLAPKSSFVRKQGTLDTRRTVSPITPRTTINTHISSARGSTSTPPREAETGTTIAENAVSKVDTPTTKSATRKRKQRDDSPDLSDFSMPDIQGLLSASPKSQKRIDDVRKRKFNHESEPTGVPDDSLQIERLLSAEDVELLSTIKDKTGREKRERELIRRQLAAEKVKVMWMRGEIAKWKELSRRIRVGDNNPHDSWNNRQEAFEELLGELMGWRVTWEKDDSNET